MPFDELLEPRRPEESGEGETEGSGCPNCRLLRYRCNILRHGRAFWRHRSETIEADYRLACRELLKTKEESEKRHQVAISLQTQLEGEQSDLKSLRHYNHTILGPSAETFTLEQANRDLQDIQTKVKYGVEEILDKLSEILPLTYIQSSLLNATMLNRAMEYLQKVVFDPFHYAFYDTVTVASLLELTRSKGVPVLVFEG